MIGIVGAEDGVDAVVAGDHPQGILGEVGTALAVVVNVLPGLTVDEGELVWSETDYFAVTIVEFFGALGEIAFEEGVGVGNT